MGFFKSLFSTEKSKASNDRTSKLQVIERAAKTGNIESMLEFADCGKRGELTSYLGITLQESREMGAAWYERAASAGSVEAMLALGDMYHPNLALIVREDAAEACKWYEKAADAGNMKGAYKAGTFYLGKNGVTKDYDKALRLLTAAADSGIADAVKELGTIYERGLGVTKSINKAIELYEKASVMGSCFADLCLGDIFYFGKGVDVNLAKAALHYAKAKRVNIPAAEVMICRMQLLGQVYSSVPLETVYKTIVRLSEGFSKDYGKCTLAMLFENGCCVEQDIPKALQYYISAAEAGSEEAMYKLSDEDNCKALGYEPACEKAQYWKEKLNECFRGH